MPYFECIECGQLASLTTLDTGRRRQYCPVCDRQTTWEVAFDAETGVSL